jgi:glycosyltransferase involved in cell wall biosynthesis
MRFAFMMKRVDFVVAGNQFLKSETLHYNPYVEVIPTSIDLSRYNLKESFHRDGPIVIGWLGSSSTLKYLKDLSPVFEDLFKIFPNTRLKIVCDNFFDLPNMPVIKKQWSLKEEVEDLKSFDIGVMPLTDDLWTRGKCGLKILQYYGVGVPVVCTPVGVNREIVNLAAEMRNDVCAIDIAGPDTKYEESKGDIIRLFEYAKERGLKTTGHIL